MYLQTPNIEEAHRGGYWGEFTPKPNEGHNAANKKSGTKFVRISEISREHIVLYNVKAVVVKKPPPPGEQPKPWVRVHALSLERLARICPEFAFPEHLPDTHEADAVEMEDEEFGEEAEEGEEGEEGNDEDPPPVIPMGFRKAETEPVPLEHFVIWADVRQGRAAWRTGVVTKAYAPGFTYRGKPYTHDAQLDGGKDVIGVNLTPELKGTGYWVPIERIYALPAPREAPATAMAADSAPVRTNHRPARNKA